MAKVSGDCVWKALLKEERFRAEVSEGQMPVFEPFVKVLPEVLVDILDEPVTLATLMNAKAVFVRYCLENGFLHAIVATVPEEQLFLFGLEGMVDMLEAALYGALDIFETIVGDAPAFLQSIGVTEEQVLTSPKVGMSKKNLKRYRAGKLTIADILVSQPSVIVKNTD